MRYLTAIGFIAFLSFSANAQDAVVSGGDHVTGPEGSISWTLGEVISATYSSNDVVLTQGQQQSRLEISTGIYNKISDIRFNTYPNPTHDLLTVSIDGAAAGKDVDITLYDLHGKALEKRLAEAGTVQFNMKSYTSGTYYLMVKKNNEVIKSFHIIKH